MIFSKLALLRRLFTHFGRSSYAGRRRWARPLGWLAPRLMRRRAHIVRANLQACFPDVPEAERERWLHTHFHLLAQSIIDRGLFWFGSREAIDATVLTSGFEQFEPLRAAGRPVIILAPHFVGLDAAAIQVTLKLPRSATLYSPQSDPDVDRIVREGRSRYNEVHLVSRREGVRGVIRHLRDGIPVYYLPDMDFGTRGAAFLPFFGVPAATLLTTAQIARSWQAVVLPVYCRLDLATGQYHVEVGKPLDDFPGEASLEDATARLNRLIEDYVRRDPTQYYWVHRRFKTRPPGAPDVYQGSARRSRGG